MKKWRTQIGGLAMALMVGAGAVGCAPEKPSDGEAKRLEVEAGDLGADDEGQAVVARINGEEIRRRDFEERYEGLREFARMRYQSKERRSDLLGASAVFEVLADEAERRDYGTHQETRRAMRRAFAQEFLGARIDEAMAEESLDEQARRAYFEAHRDDFGRPQRRRLARLWVADEERAQTLAERFEEEGPNETEEATDYFQRLAYRYSEDRQTGDFGGRSDWYEEGDEELVVADLFDREHGALHGPHAEDGGYVLEMVIDVEPAYMPEFADVEQEVARRLMETRREAIRQELLADWMSQAEISIDEEALADVEKPADRSVPRLVDVGRESAEEDAEDDAENTNQDR